MTPLYSSDPSIEVIDSAELAQRLKVPHTWVREQVRKRAVDPIPHIKLGRYVRFEWGGHALDAWLAKRRKGEKKNGPESRQPNPGAGGARG